MEFILLYLLYDESKKRTELEKQRYQDEMERWERAVNAQTIDLLNQFRNSLNSQEKQQLAEIQDRIAKAEKERSDNLHCSILMMLLSPAVLFLATMTHVLASHTH